MNDNDLTLISPDYKDSVTILGEGPEAKVFDKDGNPLKFHKKDPDGTWWFVNDNGTSAFRLSEDLIYNRKAPKTTAADGFDHLMLNLITGGMGDAFLEGGENVSKGNYGKAALNFSTPVLFKAGALGNLARFAHGVNGLTGPTGIRQTMRYASDGHPGLAVASGIGDLANSALATSGYLPLATAFNRTVNNTKQAISTIKLAYPVIREFPILQAAKLAVTTKGAFPAIKQALQMPDFNKTAPFIWSVLDANPSFRLRDYAFLADKRFYSDLNKIGRGPLMKQRRAGNYPLTTAERRLWITNFENDLRKGVDFAIDESREVNAPLRSTPTPPTLHFGTLLSINSYPNKVAPWEDHYTAYSKGRGLYFPFRNRPNTLRTHSALQDASKKIGTGAHEARHTVLKYFETPLVKKFDDAPGSYKRYPNPDLPVEFRRDVNSYINNAGTAGEWEGSLAEMDAELTGWRALYNLPRYSQMTPALKLFILKRFHDRFGNQSSYPSSLDALEHVLEKQRSMEDIREITDAVDNDQIGRIITGLEKLGYRKQGGKMNSIEQFKKGYKIKIKESQKGSFTKYCKGKVTEECIRRGKNSPNPKIRKKAVFAENSRRWKHLEGGILIPNFGLTPEEAYTINERNKNIAKLYFKESPSIYNLALGLKYAYKGWIDPAIPGQSGMAPMPGVLKEAKAVKNAAEATQKAANAAARARRYYRERAIEDPRYGITKRAHKAFKMDLAAATGDMRHALSGNVSHRHNDYYIELMSNYPAFNSKLDKIKLRLAKYEDDKTSFGYKQAKKDLNALAEEFRNTYYFKNGGLITKAQNGGSFWTSLAGQAAISGIANLGSSLMQAKLQSSAIKRQQKANLANAELLKEQNLSQARAWANSIVNLLFAQQQQDFNNGLSVSQPSMIVRDWMSNRIASNLSSGINQSIDNLVAAENASLSQQKNDAYLQALGLGVNAGLSILQNLPSKNKNSGKTNGNYGTFNSDGSMNLGLGNTTYKIGLGTGTKNAYGTFNSNGSMNITPNLSAKFNNGTTTFTQKNPISYTNYSSTLTPPKVNFNSIPLKINLNFKKS